MTRSERIGKALQLTIVEFVHPNVLHAISPNLSHSACANISTIREAVFAVDFDMLGGKSVPGITICRGSG